MTKQLIEIDVPDGWECIGFRKVKHMEWLIDGKGKAWQWPCTDASVYFYPIIVPAWQWPEWLLAEWIAMDERGRWYAHREEPERHPHCWRSDGCFYHLTGPHSVFAFTPPPCDDWKTSKRRRPAAKVRGE